MSTITCLSLVCALVHNIELFCCWTALLYEESFQLSVFIENGQLHSALWTWRCHILLHYVMQLFFMSFIICSHVSPIVYICHLRSGCYVTFTNCNTALQWILWLTCLFGLIVNITGGVIGLTVTVSPFRAFVAFHSIVPQPQCLPHSWYPYGVLVVLLSRDVASKKKKNTMFKKKHRPKKNFFYS